MTTCPFEALRETITPSTTFGMQVQSMGREAGFLFPSAECDKLGLVGLDTDEILATLEWWLHNAKFTERPERLTLGVFASNYGYWRWMARPATL